jgi:hypothetical protein
MEPASRGQVFLGGACGATRWRHEIAIPALEAAGVSYYNPQLGVGEWSEACEAAEMEAKDAAEVLLFVINGETRGVASIGEAAYYLGCGRPLALAVTDCSGLDPAERDDLNRGRIFLRSMALRHGLPVFRDVDAAVRYAIELVRGRVESESCRRLRGILADVRFGQAAFVIEEIASGFLIQLACPERDVESGEMRQYFGRKWHIDRLATSGDIVRTAFKAVLTWQEHEAREKFTYRGERLFHPHFEVDG